jgi:hypothetical protein
MVRVIKAEDNSCDNWFEADQPDDQACASSALIRKEPLLHVSQADLSLRIRQFIGLRDTEGRAEFLGVGAAFWRSGMIEITIPPGGRNLETLLMLQ